MKEARANPGKWTDWDKAYTVFQVQFHLDDADKVLDTDPAQRTQEQADLLTDHFVINYFRVITKDVIEKLKFTDLRKQLDELKSSMPFLSQAQTLAEDSARRKTWILIRGDYRSHGDRGPTSHSGVPESYAKRSKAFPADAREMGRLQRQSSDCQSGGEPHVAGVLRAGHCPDFG